MPSARVCTFAANANGRDFVVGAVHGCFRTLERTLSELQFDPARVRLFGVGDLVARSPHSIEAVDWLESRFEAVMLGNHDRAALRWLEAKLRGAGPRAEGWIRTLDPREYRRWLEALLRMPLALTFETAHGRVGVVHADAPHPDWNRATALLATSDSYHVDNALLGFEADGPAGRDTQGKTVAGLRALVSGHFVVDEVTATANCWNLDTAAGFADRNLLSLLEIGDGS